MSNKDNQNPGASGPPEGPTDHYPDIQSELRLLRLREVCERTTLSSALIYELMAQETFPQSVAIGARARAWIEPELDAWLASRLMARPDLEPGTDNAVLPRWTPELAAMAVESQHYRNGTRMQRLKKVVLRVSLKKSEIYRRIATGEFPAPVPLGVRGRAWAEHEIDAWIQAHIDAMGADPGFRFLTRRAKSESSGRLRTNRRPAQRGSRVVRGEFVVRRNREKKDKQETNES